MSKRYYWLKLKKDFFLQPEIAILEQEKEGKEILLFYLKLLLMGLDQEGSLRLNEKLPYTEKTLAMLTHTSPEITAKGMALLAEYGLLERQEDGTLYLPGLSEMVGSEAESTVRSRKSRCNATKCNENATQSKSIEKEIEIESDRETEEKNGFVVPGQDMMDIDYYVHLPFDQIRSLTQMMGGERLMEYLEKMDRFTELKRRPIKDPYETIIKWYQEDQ